MSQIIRGKIEYGSLAKKAMGGTELMMNRMVKYIPQELLEPFQIIHSRVESLDPNLKKILVLHDTHDDPESLKLDKPEFRNQFSKIVAVSDWQLQMFNLYRGIPYSQSAVINNGIEPIKQHTKPEDTINIVYHTTPHRGLAILIPVFEALCQVHKDIKLHVFSSFEIYGWAERDKPYEQLFHVAKNHPKIEYYGTVSNDEIREQLKNMHIFAYPSIWPETSCLAAIEAFSAGCVVVAPNFAGLTDTMARWGFSYQWNEDPQQHAQVFFQRLHQAINQVRDRKQNNLDNYLTIQKSYYDNFYNIHHIKDQWVELLTNLANN